MAIGLNATHDPARRSWVESANDPASDFPLQNLPLGLYRAADGTARPCTAIGDRILDIQAAHDLGLISGEARAAGKLASQGGSLNALIAAGLDAASALRSGLSMLLGSEATAAPHLLHRQAEVELLLPVAIGGFSDFLCSLPHSARMGRLNRREPVLPPSFKCLPIAYNSRASSVVASGADLVRPDVQRGLPDGTAAYGACTALDYELELGAYLVGGNRLGTTLSMGEAARQLFGYSVLNDWSARDLQRWESTPLGPFLGKSLLTTVSPWIVTAEALRPFRAPAPRHPPGDPAPFAYLDSAENRDAGALDITLEAWLRTPQTEAPHLLARTRFAEMYWTMAQMVAHHASNGCNLVAGDLIGSGTSSDTTELGRGCLAECAPDGITLPNGETRHFFLDGDEVILRGRATRDGFVAIGFGEARGRIVQKKEAVLF